VPRLARLGCARSCRSACCHGYAKSEGRVEGADAGSRKSTTRSDPGGLCSILMRY
jgi:hypothetical protein